MPTRSELLLAPVPRDGRVIEISPSFGPIATKSDGWDVRRVHHLDRAGLVAKYAGRPGEDVGRIEEVDFVWQGGLLSDAVAPAMRGTFDAFVASHVIEHTPDLIAFLGSAQVLLKPDGVLVLAVPDKRYCSDYFQPLTTTGQVLESHAEQRSRHSRRLGFDHVAYAVEDGGTGDWGQHPLRGLRLVNPIEQARDLFAAIGAGSDYVDLHAWRFTPASFELLLLELARLGETDWRVERTTAAVGCEFFAWLRRGGITRAAALTGADFSAKRLALLKRTLIEQRAQIDWLLAGEPGLVTGPLGLLPGAEAPCSPPAAPAPTRNLGAPAEASAPPVPRFVDWFPARENAGSAFAGEWSSAVPSLPTTGHADLFEDGRILWFEEKLGGFHGRQVLELGPLEGGHTHMMTQRGATVLAIESNMRAWMRCLVVKDALGMAGATFLLGDFTRYLEQAPPHVDFVLASGVLYHMIDPVRVLINLCRTSDAIGLWTHYFDPAVLQKRGDRDRFKFTPTVRTTARGRMVGLYWQEYRQALKLPSFCGGSAPGSNWLPRGDILGVLEDENFACETFLDQDDHPNGPAFCVFARRRQ